MSFDHLALPEIKINYRDDYYVKKDQAVEKEVILYRITEPNYMTTTIGSPELGVHICGSEWRNINRSDRWSVKQIVRCTVCNIPLTNHNVGSETRCKEHHPDKLCSVPGCLKYAEEVAGMCRYHAIRSEQFRVCCISSELMPVEAMIQDKNGFWYDKTIEVDFQCDNCNNPVNEEYNNDHIHIGGNNFCCESCARNSGWSQCAACCDGEWIHEDDMVYDDESDEYVCSECYNERQRERRQDRIEERNNSTRIYVEKGSEPTFGFELELYEWPEDDYDEWLPKSWGIHRDSTTGSGYEVTTPPYTMKQMVKYMEKTCKYLSNHSSVTKKEGTHMHVGNFQDIDHAVRFWQLCVEAEPLWATWLISESRKNNSYCQDTVQFNLEISENATNPRIENGTRYVKTNILSYRKHGTIEIRAHQGILEFAKMLNWAELFAKIWWHAAGEMRQPRTDNMKVWFDDLKLAEKTQQFYKERISKMHGEQELENMTPKTNGKITPSFGLYYSRERYSVKAMWDMLYKDGLIKFQDREYKDDRQLWFMLCQCQEFDETGLGTPDMKIWFQEPIVLKKKEESERGLKEATIETVRRYLIQGSRPVNGCNCGPCQEMTIAIGAERTADQAEERIIQVLNAEQENKLICVEYADS